MEGLDGLKAFEGSFFEDLRQLEFEEKPRVQSTTGAIEAVSGNAANGDHLIQGIYTDEESVDLSTLLSFGEDNLTTSTGGYVSATDHKPTASLASHWPLGSCSEVNVNFSFRNYLPPPPTTSTAHDLSMYDAATNIGASQSSMPVNVPSMPVQTTTANTSHQIAPIGMSPHVGSRPAPGKASRTKKKRMPEKGTCEYRQKRDRNNVAVRKSREKSKMRVMETEHRVKELEDENQRLQSKITLLTKELNVLKSLFTSAGVSQPASLKDQTSAQN